jgi:hypothetical protein
MGVAGRNYYIRVLVASAMRDRLSCTIRYSGISPQSYKFRLKMKCFALLSALALLPGTLSVTVYMAGDSTMAKNGGGGGTDGKSQAREAICKVHI